MHVPPVVEVDLLDTSGALTFGGAGVRWCLEGPLVFLGTTGLSAAVITACRLLDF